MDVKYVAEPQEFTIWALPTWHDLPYWSRGGSTMGHCRHHLHHGHLGLARLGDSIKICVFLFLNFDYTG